MARPPREAWLLGVRFDLFTAVELRAWLRALLEGPPETCHIAFSNAEFIVEARHNKRLRRYLNDCDCNFVDSVGVEVGLAIVNRMRRPERLSGTVFVAMLAEEAAAAAPRCSCSGRGRAWPSVQRTICNGWRPDCRSQARPTGSTAWRPSFDRIRATRPDVVSVCLGNPLQEAWVEDHLADLELKLVWGAGGALDFYSGTVPLAPAWIQRVGLEWLFRLITNFSVVRLRRQLRLIEFVALVAREGLRRGSRARRSPGKRSR